MYRTLSIQSKLRSQLSLAALVVLAGLTTGCLKTTAPDTNSDAPIVGSEDLASATMVPSGDEVDEALFAVSDKSTANDRERGRGLFRDLDLSEEQIAAIRAAFQAACAELSALAEQLKSGAITEDEYIAAAKAVHAELRETIWNILTPEQQDAVNGKLTERMIAKLTARIDRGAEHIAKRVDHMTTLLGLDEQQAADITDILEAALADLTVIRDALVAGTTDRETARAEVGALHQATRDAVLEVLTDAQEELLDGRNRDRHRNRRGGRC